MRKISKGNQSPFHNLNQQHESPPNSSKDAQRCWSNLKRKDILSSGLCVEQLSLCAYSEIRPDEYDIGSHIEHIKPKELHPELTFDYQNLVFCALSSSDLGNLDKNEVFGGHARDNKKYESDKFIECLSDECELSFNYTSSGDIEPSQHLSEKNKIRAEFTIRHLNLKSGYLVNRRKAWIDELDQLIDEHIEKNWDIDSLISIYLEPVNNKLYQFYSASKQRFKV